MHWKSIFINLYFCTNNIERKMYLYKNSVSDQKVNKFISGHTNTSDILKKRLQKWPASVLECWRYPYWVFEAAFFKTSCKQRKLPSNYTLNVYPSNDTIISIVQTYVSYFVGQCFDKINIIDTLCYCLCNILWNTQIFQNILR